MKKANSDIRDAARVANVKLWQIAAELGINDVTFTKRLRFELPQNEKSRILSIIHRLSLRMEAETDENDS